MDGCLRNLAVLISLLLIGIPSIHSLTPEECYDSRSQCWDSFNITSSLTGSDVCDLAYNVSQCFSNQTECLSEAWNRIVYLKAKQYMDLINYTGCDLERISPEPIGDCERGRYNCLKTYADRLLYVDANGISTTAVACQTLITYDDCQRGVSECSSDTTLEGNLTRQFEEEEVRMRVTCVDPQIRPIETDEQCDQFMSQCNVLIPAAADPEYCNKTKDRLECIVGGHCKSDIILRILRVQAERDLEAKNISCNISDAFSAPATDACSQGEAICRETYVDSVLEKAEPTKEELCGHLNTFISCQMDVDGCSKVKADYETLADEEQTRMNVQCTLSAFNHGSQVGVSLLLVATAALVKIMFE